MATIAYRLRVRNASDSADALSFTSVAGGANPYIVDAPSGDGQEVDLITGAVRLGAYVITVQDTATGTDGTGTVRIITNALEDAGGRQQLLSRRAYIEVSRDGGSTWPEILQAGYLTNLQQADAITYAFTVSDSRRIESSFRAFTWASAAEQSAFPNRGCLVGGPIKGGWGTIEDLGGWQFSVFAAESEYLALNLQSCYIPPQFVRTVDFAKCCTYANKMLQPFAAPGTADVTLTDQAFQAITDGGQYLEFPNLVVEMEKVTAGGASLGMAYGELKAFFPLAVTEYTNGLAINVYVKRTSGVTLAATDRVRLRIISREVTESSPLYIDAHPVDIATALYTVASIPYDAASAAAMKAAIGDTVRYAMRITQPQLLGEFLTSAIFGPFGFSARTNSAGARVFFLTRRVGTGTPSLSIGTADVQGDAPPVVFDLDESTVSTSYRFRYRSFSTAITGTDANVTPPSDGVVENTIELVVDSGDTSTYATREIAFDMPGMIHDATNFTSAMADWVYSESRLGFDRFGRGAPSILLPVLATSSAAAAQVGDEVLVNVSYYPNRNYRIGESTVGARVAQVVRREETPEGPIFKLVDAGLAAQVGTAATISVAATATNPRTLAAFTITNAATLNAASLGAEVEWATGSSSPAGGQTLAYAAGAVPTGAVTLPPVPPGTRVWVRARGIQPLRRASAWSAWTSVTLTGYVAPSGVSTASVTASSAVASWTVGNTEDAVIIYVAPGSVAPSDWKPYTIGKLLPGSTTIQLPNLSPSTAYIVGVAHRDLGSGGTSSVATATFTTLATSVATAPRVAGTQIITFSKAATNRTGVALAIFPAAGGYSTVVERSPNGSTGWEVLATLDPTATVFVDYQPSDGVSRYYRVKHTAPGYNDSAYLTATPSGVVPYGIPASVVRPDAITPTVDVASNVSATAVQIYLTLLNNDQRRVVDVESSPGVVSGTFEIRSRINAGAWSAWVGTFGLGDIFTYSAGQVLEIEWRMQSYNSVGALGYWHDGATKYPQNYGTLTPQIQLQRSGYNAGTGKYEIWFRYYAEVGNNTRIEDPLVAGVTPTIGPIASSVKDQTGTLATNVVTSGTKQTDGWYASWDSTGTQQWTFSIGVTSTSATVYDLPQDPTRVVTPLPVTNAYASFVVPAGAPATGGGDVTGPASSTLNAVPRFSDTSGKVLKNSGIIVDDSNNVTGAASLVASTYVQSALFRNSGAALSVGTVTAHTLDLLTNNVLQVRIASGGTATFTQPVVSGANYGANFGNGYFFANNYSGADPWFGGWNANASAGSRRSMLYMGSDTKLGLTDDSGGYSRTALHAVRSSGLLYIGGDSGGATLFTSVTIAPLAILGAATTSRASVRLPHGTAPSAPTNGDLWTTTAGLYAQISGATVGPFISAASNITGNAATATALATARTIWGQSFDGTANVSGALSGATTGSFSDLLTAARFIANGTISAGTYSADFLGVSGAARDVLRAGVNGVSNGFTVQYTGSAMSYRFVGGALTVGDNTSGVSTLSVNRASLAAIPALGTQTGNQFAVLGDNAAYGLLAGVLVTGSVYLQATYTNGTATAFDILLNPLGGRVGIGTSSPNDALEVLGNIRTSPGANRYLQLGSASNYYYRLQAVGDDLHFIEAASTVRMVIKYPNGYVGIGTTSPSQLLHISGGNMLIGGTGTATAYDFILS